MTAPAAPPLTLPDAVADLVRDTYDRASAILEYGSGGSTVLAAERGKPCLTVENDRAWGKGVAAWLDHAHPGHGVRLHLVYIGPTRKWGRPSKTQAPLWRWRYKAYPTSVWNRRDLTPPDVILIDGRFRPACFLTSLLRLDRPATLLWDDYEGRPEYRVVERVLAPARMVERMAVFRAQPGLVTKADLSAFKSYFHDPE
ncbi:MAG: hypothetical protein AAGG09_11070 [Pseudomonadota bacterium]